MAYKLQLKRGSSGSLPTGSAGEPLFTTDTNDLYIGTGAANQRFQKYIASGTSSQFLKGDGSLDSNTYYLASNPSSYIALTALTASSPLLYNNTTGVFSIQLGTDSQNGYLSSSDRTTFNNKQDQFTVSSPLSFSGLNITISQASGGVNGFLSSTDWTTFNNKQNTITNPVTGTGTTNYLPKWTSGSAIGNSNLINDASGNLGLGVTPSAWQSDVKAIQIGDVGSNICANNAAYSGGNNVWINNNSFQNSSVQDIYTRTATAGQYQIQGNTHIWRTAPSGTAGNAITFTQAMTLTSGGNLLVGTTTDSGQRLAVNGSVKFDSDAATNGFYWDNTNKRLGIGENSPQAKLYVRDATSGYTAIISNTSAGGDYLQMLGDSGNRVFEFGSGGTGGDGFMNVYSDNVQKVLVNADGASYFNGGNLLVGTTTDSGEKLQVNGTGRFSKASSGDAMVTLNATSGPYTQLYWNNANVTKGSIYWDNTESEFNYYTTGTHKFAGAATFSSSVTATSFIKSGGTSSQYLMADGSVTTGGGLISTNRQTASYTLALTDADKLVEMNVATANNLTVPLNSSVAFAIGTKIDLSQYGAGQTTVVATSGVTVRSAGGALKLALQYSGASLVKIATNEWYLFGDITV